MNIQEHHLELLEEWNEFTTYKPITSVAVSGYKEDTVFQRLHIGGHGLTLLADCVARYRMTHEGWKLVTLVLIDRMGLHILVNEARVTQR